MALLLVQFLHPGAEHISKKRSTYPWNTGRHKRKFMVTSGHYITTIYEQKPNFTDELYFWGEWEPTSDVLFLYKNGRNMFPHCSHSPFLFVQKSGNVVCQGVNTDPFVFGKNFLYSLCQQTRYPSLRSLAPYSIILFGSNKNSSFVIDTVFVVKNSKENYLEKEPIDTDGYCQTSMYPPHYESIMGAYKMPDSANLTMYEGVNFCEREQYQEMFSYVPCKLGCKNSGFARVEIKNEELNQEIQNRMHNASGYNLISDKLKRGIHNTILSQSFAKIVWESVTAIILREGYYLGFCIDYNIKKSTSVQTVNNSSNCGCKPSNQNCSC